MFSLSLPKAKQRSLMYCMICLLLASGILLLLLNSCQSAAEASALTIPSNALPKRVALIQMPEPYTGLMKTIILPNGQVYAMSIFGALAMLKDDTISTMITFPNTPPYFFPDLKNMDFNPYKNLVYTVDSTSRLLYEISDTQIITSLTGAAIFSDPYPFPLDLIVNPATGELYASALLTSTNPVVKRLAILSDTRVITTFDIPYVIHSQLYSLQDQSLYFEGIQMIPRGNEGYTDDSAMLTKVNAQHQMTTTNLTKILDGMGMPNHVGISAMTVDPQSGLLYLRMNRDILRWDGESLTPLATIELENVNVITPMGIDWKRGLLYVGIPESYLEVFDLQQAKLLDRVAIDGVGPKQIVYDTKHDYIYLINYNSSSLTILRGTEVMSDSMLMQCGGPWDIALDDKRDRFYVTCADWGGAVSIFEYPKEERSSLWSYLPWISR